MKYVQDGNLKYGSDCFQKRKQNVKKSEKRDAYLEGT